MRKVTKWCPEREREKKRNSVQEVEEKVSKEVKRIVSMDLKK